MEPLFLASMRRWHEDRSSKRLLGTINECEKCIRTFNLLCAFNCSVMSDSFATAWTAACQALLSMEFFRQEYWSGLPFPPSEDLLPARHRDWTQVSCIGRWVLYHWATWEALYDVNDITCTFTQCSSLKCKVVTERKLQFLPVLERCLSLHFFLLLLLLITDRRTMVND